MSEAVERLRYLCSPDAARLGDLERLNQFIKYGLEVLAELEESQREAADAVWADNVNW